MFSSILSSIFSLFSEHEASKQLWFNVGPKPTICLNTIGSTPRFGWLSTHHCYSAYDLSLFFIFVLTGIAPGYLGCHAGLHGQQISRSAILDRLSCCYSLRYPVPVDARIWVWEAVVGTPCMTCPLCLPTMNLSCLHTSEVAWITMTSESKNGQTWQKH